MLFSFFLKWEYLQKQEIQRKATLTNWFVYIVIGRLVLAFSNNRIQNYSILSVWK